MLKPFMNHPIGIIGPNEVKLNLFYPYVDLTQQQSIIKEYLSDIPGGVAAVIPYHSRYLADTFGNIYDRYTGDRVPQSTDYKGYKRVSIYKDGTEIKYSRQVHRLVLLAFRPVSKAQLYLVNHIDNVKDNNRLENLEWVTNGQNVQHGHATRRAMNADMTSVAMGVCVRNIFTGESWEFEHVFECAKHFNIHKDTVLYRLDFPINKLWPGGYQFKRRYDTRPWPEVTYEDIMAINGNGGSKEVTVRLYDTGDILNFPSITKVAEYFNVAVSAIWTKVEKQPDLVAHNLGPDSPIFQIKYKYDVRPWVTYPTKYHALEEASDNIRVYVAVDTHRHEQIFTDLNKMAKSLGVGNTTLHYRINRNKKDYWPDGYIYLYYVDWYNYKNNIS